jgi:hypothetical protein
MKERRMQQWNKGPKRKMAAMSEKGEDSWQWHQRTKQETFYETVG